MMPLLRTGLEVAMDLSALAGNALLKENLFSRGEGQALSHAYIISGPRGSGRHTLAGLLAEAMVCTARSGEQPCGRCSQCRKAKEGIHPDIMLVTGEKPGKPISVDQIRAVRADAYIRPNEGARKIYIAEEADRMQPSAQNAMLKLLEEGPEYAAFLLLAENPSGLLPTVRSRCEILRMTPLSVRECARELGVRFPRKSGEELEKAARACQGFLGRAVEALDESGASRAELEKEAAGLADALENAEEAELFEALTALDRGSRDELITLLEVLSEDLAERLARASDRGRLYRAAGLVQEMLEAARSNVSGGQIAGWLCAALFADNTGSREGQSPRRPAEAKENIP